MSDEIIFYTNAMSRGRIVRWMLEEVGQPYRTELIDFGPMMKVPAYKAINNMGKVPSLKHGDAIVTEAGAICAYLADAFPAAGLAPPPTSRARAPYYRWMFFAAGPVEAAVVNGSLNFTPPADMEGRVGYGSMAAVLDTLEKALSHDHFIAGDKFSAADVYFGSHIGWGMMFGGLEKRPAFERYWARIGNRPAAIKARAIDDAILAEQKAKAPA